jgi:NAD(P)-dependent dehydrogenase (short-subunit alcohol dehydrogenase family)
MVPAADEWGECEPMSLENKTVLVTGASQGIGRATAEAFLAKGARVALVARSAEKLAEVAAPHGDRALALPCDVSDPASVDALFEAIRAAWGRLDVVFNNAGAGLKAAEIADVSWEDWRNVLKVNVDGVFLIARGAYAMMRAQDPKGGRIINNGSISAHAPRPGSIAYTAGKHAVTGITKTISLDGRKHDIACCQIDIGNAASAMTDAMRKGVPQADGTLKPEPVMDVAHVAHTVVTMADLPLDVNMQFVTIMATKMPFVGRG